MQLACAPPAGFLPARKTSGTRHSASRRGKVTQRADLFRAFIRTRGLPLRPVGLVAFKVLRVRVFSP